MTPEETIDTNDPDLALVVLQPGEIVIGKVKRHPVGAFWIYFTAFVAILAIVSLVVIMAPSMFNEFNRNRVLPPFVSGVAAMGLIAFLMASLAEKIYWNNKWVLTSDSLTQILQTGLFKKQSSQLSLANIEDVSFVKNGILTQFFDYGKLVVETAGKRPKFKLTYCANPDYYARQILAAREDYHIKKRKENEV